MTKTILLTFALALTISLPAMAKDDGGFGVTSTGRTPASLGDNTQELIAKGEIMDPSVANIEPAAGDEAKDKAAPKKANVKPSVPADDKAKSAK